MWSISHAFGESGPGLGAGTRFPLNLNRTRRVDGAQPPSIRFGHHPRGPGTPHLRRPPRIADTRTSLGVLHADDFSDQRGPIGSFELDGHLGRDPHTVA